MHGGDAGEGQYCSLSSPSLSSLLPAAPAWGHRIPLAQDPGSPPQPVDISCSSAADLLAASGRKEDPRVAASSGMMPACLVTWNQCLPFSGLCI